MSVYFVEHTHYAYKLKAKICLEIWRTIENNVISEHTENGIFSVSDVLGDGNCGFRCLYELFH